MIQTMTRGKTIKTRDDSSEIAETSPVRAFLNQAAPRRAESFDDRSPAAGLPRWSGDAAELPKPVRSNPNYR